MDNAKASELLQHLYLNGVRPNGRDIGVGAYGRVFEVEFCGTIYASLACQPLKNIKGLVKRPIQFGDAVLVVLRISKLRANL